MSSRKTNDAPSSTRPLSRAERRHGAKRPAPEPELKINKNYVIGAAVVLVVAALMGIKTSLQAASSSKPFSMEGFKKNKGKGGGGAQAQAGPRDVSEEDFPNGDWLQDPTMAREMSIDRCDVDRMHYSNLTTKRFEREYEGIKPVILEGFVEDKWPARTAGRWARPSLISAFGDSPLHVSSGAGIVHSGGESLRTVTLNNFLQDLRDNDGSGASARAFTFDLEFIDKNKEMKNDFKVPTIFRRFNSHESMRRGSSWSMLSLGASGAGLPFHAHGETWLGLAYGAKRWALYPPTIPRPYKAEEQGGWHPLQGSLEWFQDVIPVIGKTGEKTPLECMQNPGDLFYLPANWRHMTLNIGETIGVGGQAVYDAETRLRHNLELLITSDDDPEVFHSTGVALAHKGIELLTYGDSEREAEEDEAIEDPSELMTKLREGQVLSGAKTIGLASYCLGQAVKLRPGHPESHIILAETLMKAGKGEEAERVIEAAWKRFSRAGLPDGIPDATIMAIQLNLARFFLQSDEGEKAEQYLRQGALALEPDHGDAYADLAVALAMQGRMEESMSAVDTAEELGAAGNSFRRRRELVMRIMIKDAQEKAARREQEMERETKEDVAQE